MQRTRGDMASPKYVMLLFALIVSCSAGPLGPLPNVTSLDLGLKEGSCALGDVVYLPGDVFPGAGACERCSCAGGSVRCERQRCEPRAGCKAVHRPDHCCPTYQCECEQEGRVYDNGEKLVDPRDPCKVCYCQGGEVVCRRIACFVRDDCTPRLVPGRCCPEYDNCPLRGVTTLPGASPSIPSTSAVENVESSAPSLPKNEHIKQEITIKEITPVSEIPVITGVKIKEILPSPTIEVAEYSSSKSPLITREATSEKTITEETPKTEAPSLNESSVPSSASSELASSSSNDVADIKSSNDPSKISLPTQDSINSEFSPSIVTMGSPSVIPEVIQAVLTTKAPIIEDEDLSVIDHNPLFPPIPDDLTVSRNHEDEIVQQEQNLDSEHTLDIHEVVSVSSPPTSTTTEGAAVKEVLSTTVHYVTDSVSITSQETSSELNTSKEILSTTESTDKTSSRENSMINLRSAIPTEILNVPSLVAESVTEEVDESTGIPVTEIDVIDSSPEIIMGTDSIEIHEDSSNISNINAEQESITSTETDIPYSDSTYKPEDEVDHATTSDDFQEQTTNFISKSNVATEITSQTELSSIPIETSDQKPHDSSSEKLAQDRMSTSTDPAQLDTSTTKLLTDSSETVSKANNDDQSFENMETTEFILSSFDSTETATEPVEIIKISPDTGKKSSIIEHSSRRNNNVLTDLINLVGDVASISDHADSSDAERPTTGRTTISDSEELLLVNTGYKSKNSNRNQNSITEIPVKNKATIGNKQKIVEIEDDDTDNITDSPPPHDKVEPTTRRPIIDNVSDDVPSNKTEKSGKKDIEIITQSYVPTINRRPTKVVMKKNNEKPLSEEVTTEEVKNSTENNVEVKNPTTTAPVFDASSSETAERAVEGSDETTTPAQ